MMGLKPSCFGQTKLAIADDKPINLAGEQTEKHDGPNPAIIQKRLKTIRTVSLSDQSLLVNKHANDNGNRQIKPRRKPQLEL